MNRKGLGDILKCIEVTPALIFVFLLMIMGA